MNLRVTKVVAAVLLLSFEVYRIETSTEILSEFPKVTDYGGNITDKPIDARQYHSSNQTLVVSNDHKRKELNISESVLRRNNTQGDQKAKFVYVHVGKTGGLTLDLALKASCNWHANPKSRKSCLKLLHAQGPESIISQRTLFTIHCVPRGRLDPQMAQVNSFLVTVRNPIARAVSAFNFGHPDNNLGTNPNRKKNISENAAKFYVDCFPTVEHMAIVLQRGDDGATLSEQEEDCFNLAAATLKGAGSLQGAGHLFYNYAHYDNILFSKFAGRDYWIVRTEHLWNDLSQVDQLLGGNGNFSHAGESKLHNSQTPIVSVGLSDKGIRTFCCYLSSELQLYEDLLRRAVNLSPSEINETAMILYTQCGVTRQELDVDARNSLGSFQWTNWVDASPVCLSKRRQRQSS